MSTIVNVPRDSLARYIRSKCAFKLRVPSAGVLLKPVYDFEHAAIDNGTYIAIVSQRQARFHLEVGQVLDCDFCVDEGAIIYSVILAVRNMIRENPRIHDIASREIDCVFEIAKMKVRR